MIHSDVDKSTMPDGSASLSETIHNHNHNHHNHHNHHPHHTEVLPPLLNGDQESPLGGPESPEDKGIIRCICGIDEDDGFTIFCERCSVWQHGACVGIYDEKDAPEKYLCEECNPRPLDVQKAIRHQRQRQDAEQHNHKPKRRTSQHPKSKPNHQTTTLGPSPSLPPPQNRKEKHPSPPRRTEGKRPRATARGQSAPQVETVVPEEVDVMNDDEPDLPFLPVAKDYDHRDQNELSPEISPLLEQRLQQLDTLNIEDLPPEIERLDSIRDYVHKTLRQPISKKFSAPSSNFVRQFGLFAAEPLNENDLIVEFTGQIGLQQTYKNDPINQYSILRRPKQYVLFSPPNTLDIYVDARLYGNDTRYVRRSCFPNARVALVCVQSPPDRGIHFGLFATKNIKPRDEITIGHDWNLALKMEEMIWAVRDETRPLLDVYPSEMIKSMATYAPTILANGDCACHDDHCIFVRLRKALASLPETSSRRNSSGDADAMSIDRSDDLEGSEMEDDSRPNSRGYPKPSSRDRTPSKDGVPDAAAPPRTAREQRKIDQVLQQFARMEEKEKEKSGDKRRKSDTMDIDDSQLSTTAKRRRQSSITADSVTRPTAQRLPSAKGRGIKRKSMSPSPGADRISESGASANESPKPGGRVPNRVKRSMKGRQPKEPSNKKVRLQPPDQNQKSTLPKWVPKVTLSDSWTPPQMLWYKKYTENAKRKWEEEENLKQCKEPESQHVSSATPSEVVSTEKETTATSPPAEAASLPRTTPNLRVAMPPSTTFPAETSQAPLTQTPVSATPSQSSTSYFPTSTGSTSTAPQIQPPVTPGTPSTPKLKKLSLADYRARRASGIVTPSISTMADPMTSSDSFAAPPAPSQGSKSPDPKPVDPPPTT